MNLMIKRTGKCVHLICRDILGTIEDYNWNIAGSLFVAGIIMGVSCIGGLEEGDKLSTLKPWVSGVFNVASVMVTASLVWSALLIVSYPCKWVRNKWRLSCQYLPAPQRWDEEENL